MTRCAEMANRPRFVGIVNAIAHELFDQNLEVSVALRKGFLWRSTEQLKRKRS